MKDISLELTDEGFEVEVSKCSGHDIEVIINKNKPFTYLDIEEVAERMIRYMEIESEHWEYEIRYKPTFRLRPRGRAPYGSAYYKFSDRYTELLISSKVEETSGFLIKFH